jgi:phosphatidylserine/phosphatidylglycerophosphate/cardiolipin synthase-like enzyme
MNNYGFISGLLAGILLFTFLSLFFLPAYSIALVESPSSENEILSLIDSAGDSLYVEVYLLSSGSVVDSLIAAKERGVDVRVILEERVTGDANPNSFSRLSANGVDVCWASRDYKLTHSKYIIVDGRKALVGSHNLSNAAFRDNREVSLLVEGNIASYLTESFLSDWAACT